MEALKSLMIVVPWLLVVLLMVWLFIEDHQIRLKSIAFVGIILYIFSPLWLWGIYSLIPSEILTTIFLLLLVILFFPWFIMYRLGKWKGRKKWWALDKKLKEENAERARLSEQKKYTYEYYDNPNDHSPNAYGYCGTEREDEELMNAICNGPKDGVKDKKTNDPLIEAQKKELKNLLTKRLTRAERLIIVLYYYEEMTIKEIAQKLDLSEARVSQMHSSIIARLKSDI